MSADWPKVRLGEVVNDLTNQRIFAVSPDQEILDPTITSATHQIAVAARNTGASVRVTKRVGILPGDIVFSRLHTQNGAFAFADKEFQATGTFIPCSVVEEKVDKRFLFWALHVHVPLLSASDTVGRETYKTQDIFALEIPLPPLSEQRRIVAKIDLLAAKIEEARGLKERSVSQTGFLIASVTENVLHSLLVNGTEEKTLESVCVRVTDGAHHTPKFLPTGVPLVMAANVSDNHLDLANVGYISDKDHEEIYRRAPVEKGDVLFINIGATTGTVKKIDVDEKFSIKNVALLKPNRQLLDSDYLVYFLRSRTVKDRIALKQSQTCQPFLSLRDLRTLTLPVPHLEDQRRIVAYLDDLQAKINKLKELQHETAAELDSLLPSILDKAFKGEL